MVWHWPICDRNSDIPVNNAALPPEVLSPDELRAMTGYVYKAHQREWLKKHGIKFYPRADGFPIVPRGIVERPSTPERTTQPNWGALNGTR